MDEHVEKPTLRELVIALVAARRWPWPELPSRRTGRQVAILSNKPKR